MSVMLIFLFKYWYAVNSENLSPFEFIKELKGCQKGDKVKGIHELKIYLQKFGYLSYAHCSKINNDDFDDMLEFAIRTYQTNYNLEVSGNLDSKTVSAMVKPRCGVADIINGTSRMRSSGISMSLDPHMEHHHEHGSDLRTVAHYSFFPGNPRWPTSKIHLTFSFLSGTPTAAMTEVRKSFLQWASATHFTFTETQDYRNADLTVGFHRRDHGDGAPFDGRGGTIAHAFAPTDGRFHFDEDETWTVGAGAGAFDLGTIALHEIGHLLGLGHSSVPGAIMFPTLSPGVSKGLHQDDIQGIQDLYNSRITRTSSCTYEIL